MRAMGALALALALTDGFVMPGPAAGVHRSRVSMTVFPASTHRRAFFAQGAAVLAAGAAGVAPCFAEMEDLSSGDRRSPEEEEKERIRKKLEAQQKATGTSKSGRRTYKDSVTGELEKQKAQKRDRAQRRVDMCEELGRGC